MVRTELYLGEGSKQNGRVLHNAVGAWVKTKMAGRRNMCGTGDANKMLQKIPVPIKVKKVNTSQGITVYRKISLEINRSICSTIKNIVFVLFCFLFLLLLFLLFHTNGKCPGCELQDVPKRKPAQ